MLRYLQVRWWPSLNPAYTCRYRADAYKGKLIRIVTFPLQYAAACMVNDKNGAVIKERKCQNKCGTDGREIVYEGKKLTAYYCEPPHSKDDLEDTIERLAALIDKRHGKGKLQKGGSYGNRPYGGTGHGGSYYDNWQYGGDGYGTGPYGNKPYGSDGGFYDNWPYGSQGYGGSYYDNWQYSNNGHGTGSYDNWQYGNDGYGTGSFGNWQYGNGGYGTGSYGNWQYGNDGYGTGSYGNWQYGNGGYGTGSYGNRPSSSESEGGDSSDWWDFWPFDKDGGSSEVSRHDNHEDVKNMPGDRPLPGGHPNHPGKPHNPGPWLGGWP